MKGTLKTRAQIGQYWYNFTELLAQSLTNQKIENEIEYIHKIKYGTSKANVANIMYRRDLEDVKKPLFIYIHGGGYISGKLDMRNQQVQNYAKLGFLAFSIDYTVSPQAIYPTPIQECFNAVDWLLDKQDIYNIDMKNILIAGESAGGYFITMFADLINNPEKMERIGVSFKHAKDVKIKGIISHCGAFDLNRMTDKSKKQSKFPDIIMMCKAFVGKSGKEFFEWLQTEDGKDSIPTITPSFPPTFVIWGAKDYLRYESFDFMEDLKANNVPYDQFEANKEVANHAWSIMTQFKTAKAGYLKSLDFILPYFDEYFVKEEDTWKFKN